MPVRLRGGWMTYRSTLFDDNDLYILITIYVIELYLCDMLEYNYKYIDHHHSYYLIKLSSPLLDIPLDLMNPLKT
jgi:hypothetical protein